LSVDQNTVSMNMTISGNVGTGPKDVRANTGRAIWNASATQTHSQVLPTR
jgi:hypothetical protein